MYKRALKGFEELLGSDDLATLYVVNDLAILYSQRKALDRAAALFERARLGWEKTTGASDGRYLHVLSNLGNLYLRQGRLDQADTLLPRALVELEKKWGPDNIQTLYAVNNLAHLRIAQARTTEAEVLCKRALNGFARDTGINSELSLQVSSKFGHAWYQQRNLDRAETLFKRVFQGYKGLRGPAHGSTRKAHKDLVMVQDAQAKSRKQTRAAQGQSSGGPAQNQAASFDNSESDLIDAVSGKSPTAAEIELFKSKVRASAAFRRLVQKKIQEYGPSNPGRIRRLKTFMKDAGSKETPPGKQTAAAGRGGGSRGTSNSPRTSDKGEASRDQAKASPDPPSKPTRYQLCAEDCRRKTLLYRKQCEAVEKLGKVVSYKYASQDTQQGIRTMRIRDQETLADHMKTFAEGGPPGEVVSPGERSQTNGAIAEMYFEIDWLQELQMLANSDSNEELGKEVLAVMDRVEKDMESRAERPKGPASRRLAK